MRAFLRKREMFRLKYYLTGLFFSMLLQDIETGEVTMTPEKMRQYKRYFTRRYGYGNKRGILQIELDRNFDNILTSLKTEFPYFDKRQIQIFSYAAADIPDSLAALMTGSADGKAVWTIKNKMIEAISIKDVPRRDEYLLMMSTTSNDQPADNQPHIC